MQQQYEAAQQQHTAAMERYDRLLEMPHQAPAPTTITLRARGAVARGAMRQDIIALLQAHPEGLTPAQIRTHLGVEKPLAHTCIAMMRDGLIRRLGAGRYRV